METQKMNEFNFEIFWAAIQNITNLAQETFNNPAYREYIRILIFGTEATGKSTLFHLLIGDKIIAINTNRGFVLDCFKSKAQHISISKCIKSMFSIPNVYVDHQNKFIFIDCPNLYNDEFSFQNLINIFLIHTIFKIGGKFKFLLVISYDAFHSCRGQRAIQNFEIIDYLIPDKNILKQSLALFITKKDDDYDILDYLEYIKRGDIAWLIDYFLNEGKNKIFTVPKPNEEGVYNNLINIESAFEILKNNLIDLQHIEINIYYQCIDQIKIITMYLHDELSKSFENFKKTIFSFYEKETDLSKLITLEKKVDSLIAACKIGLNQFDQQISNVFPIESIEINDRIEKINLWKNFIHDILDESMMMNINNLDIDLSPLISSFSYHLINIKNIKKLLQKKAEKELPIEENRNDELNSVINEIKAKIILDEKLKELQVKFYELRKENEMLQRRMGLINEDPCQENSIEKCLIQ